MFKIITGFRQNISDRMDFLELTDTSPFVWPITMRIHYLREAIVSGNAWLCWVLIMNLPSVFSSVSDGTVWPLPQHEWSGVTQWGAVLTLPISIDRTKSRELNQWKHIFLPIKTWQSTHWYLQCDVSKHNYLYKKHILIKKQKQKSMKTLNQIKTWPSVYSTSPVLCHRITLIKKEQIYKDTQSNKKISVYIYCVNVWKIF